MGHKHHLSIFICFEREVSLFLGLISSVLNLGLSFFTHPHKSMPSGVLADQPSTLASATNLQKLGIICGVGVNIVVLFIVIWQYPLSLAFLVLITIAVCLRRS